MNKLILIVLAISLLGNFIGIYFAWEYRIMKGQIANLQDSVAGNRQSVDWLSDTLDRSYPHRLVFLHHSVGNGLFYRGGLGDSLKELGIAARGATYGDEVGQLTDIADWLPKFRNDMSRILSFKGHPNVYYKDSSTNDVIMFKSCYPNSYVDAEGVAPGDPVGREQTMANYRAAFEGLGKEMQKYPNKLFVYLTYPPLVPSATKPEIAARARQFNRWLIEAYLPQYRKETGLKNFVVFDLFNVLADESNVLKAEYRGTDPNDSHPNEPASREAVQRFMEFFRPVWSAWLASEGSALNAPEQSR
jgi:hypothetical protein